MEFDLNVLCADDDIHNKVENDHLTINEEEDTMSLCLQLENRLEIDKTVDSLDQAYLLYCEYARLRGFSVRKGDQTYYLSSNEVRAKEYKCSCEGVHDNKRSKHALVSYKKQNFRTECKARIRFVRESCDTNAHWKVQRFAKEHNHELVPIHQSYLLRSARQMTHSQKSIVKALKLAGIGVSRACRFFEMESGGPQNLNFTRKDVYNHLSSVQQLKTNIANVDANSLVKFFVSQSTKEPFFYWNTQLDSEGKLMNFFFRDSRCLIDYEHFGDVLSVDTTYKTNKYGLICVPFVGINHHMHNVMFGLAFLSNETTGSFEWLFETFLESMHGREPSIIFSDQGASLIHGIDSIFRTASHRLCQCHICRNAPSHFGQLNDNKEFKRQWHYCMNGVENEAEFERCWHSMISDYGLADNRWFGTMYKLRRRWAASFTNNSFSAGLLATSRSEVTNKVLKDLCSATSCLSEFVQKYQQIVSDWRAKESADDFANIGTPGLIVANSMLSAQAAKILTRNVFKLFENQMASAVAVVIIVRPVSEVEVDLVYEVASQPSLNRIRCVTFNRESHMARCSCRL